MRTSWNDLPSDREVDLLDTRHVGSQRLAIRQLRRSVRALGIQEIEEGAVAALIHVGGDVERLAGTREVTGFEQREDLLAVVERVDGVGDVGQDRRSGLSFELGSLAYCDL